MADKLKPCPFCGEKDQENICLTVVPGDWLVAKIECLDCGGSAKDGGVSSTAEAPYQRIVERVIERWNRRASDE